ncbi:hypothetical protein BDV32DRAFT_149138 [Aspergillus pseudonomiae]|uniref:Uncharacterized protein n=1 Tax=Aspergillus pseudonomiae TaxID=1506151 RepID=A0A5N7DJ87_9EURO|nr:uncharacterized protein BDV37DRAFT_280921 [Aspergillus pseudonomiae]KAB8260703.1 hypothetical protein BDV32DRAFT_149138 [Aspergillus pseudonomiae]KAE8406325.1 hypothetical protein BDV37DRAFT_280921 [Aspergillus pseudonomiae]
MEKLLPCLVNRPFDSHHIWQSTESDDILALVLGLLIVIILLYDSSLFHKNDAQSLWHQCPQGVNDRKTISTDINIAQATKDQGKDIVIFYGTQSGTSYELARHLSRSIFQLFSKATIVADLSDYDYDSLSELPPNVIVLFILSTYGEGDPPDNAIRFDEWLDKGLRQHPSGYLSHLHYAVLGLGNSNYKHYNQFSKKVQKELEAAGGCPILDLTLADDSSGFTRGDYSEWSRQLINVMVEQCNIPKRPRPYEPVFEIEPCDSPCDYRAMSRPIHSPSGSEQIQSQSAIYSANIASITNLTPHAQQTTLHIEIDTSRLPRAKYNVGDHLLIWPENSTQEIQRLSQILGIDSKEMHQPLQIRRKDRETKCPWPQQVTIHTLFKHHLDIAGLASNDLILSLKEFAPDEKSRAVLDQMAADYRHLSATCALSLASVLTRASGPSQVWTIPFPFLLENLSALKPRIYSIASSPALSPRQIALTVAVKELNPGTAQSALGLASAFFLGARHSLTPDIQGTEGRLGTSVWCSLRKSKFKPPASTMHPIIMVANGSGIAPFIGFLKHRLRKLGIEGGVGKMVLIYGCRDGASHLYKDELYGMQSAFNGQLGLITAYSRKGEGYVQDHVRSRAEELQGLLCGEKANVYICGSVRMSSAVREELLSIIQRREGWTDAETRDFEGAQIRMRKWQLDVWG